MKTFALLEKLSDLGVTITVVDGSLCLEPGSKVPAEVMEDLRQNKAEIISVLMSRRYHQKYPKGEDREQELVEVGYRVHLEGFVLLWSHVLEDFIAFYRDKEAKAKIPPGFVPYSVIELEELFGENKPVSLKLIHEAKKLGGCVVAK